ncbi:MAG TPA: outer membrane beta-barrel protein [Gemmatimonadaceae bacterium]|nr:outer membrane beta-barrel protein [Gemmatimonadaceae bacterium]
MKRSIVVLAIASLIALPLAANAQGISVKGGLSYGSIPNNNGALPGTLSRHDGFAVGVGLSTGGVIGIGVEGLYAQRGFESSVAGESQKLDYVDVPAYLRVKIPIPAIAPFAYAGPQVSFEVKCDADGGTCPSGRKKTTYAGTIGAGLKLLGAVTIEGRYVYGLTDLHLSTVSDSDNYKTRSFMLLAGIGF